MRLGLLAIFMLMVAAAADEARSVKLCSPLTTVVHLAGDSAVGGTELIVDIEVPADAPADIGVGAFLSDRHGGWWQRAAPGRLLPGCNRLRFTLGADDRLESSHAPTGWTAADAATATRAGIFLWSQSSSNATLEVSLRAQPLATASTAGRPRLLDLESTPTATTGERWTMHLRPEPFPANPYDPDEFLVDAVFTAPDGSEQRVPGFCAQPMQASDRGDSEAFAASAPSTFAVRFRPRQAGNHRVRLEARWRDRPALTCEMPALAVQGAPWDGYARRDAGDPRFFSAAGAMVWPIGANMHGVNDLRSQAVLGTKPIVDRGSFAYGAWFDRIAASGATACELWMSSWGCALEWRGDWAPFHGLGRYSQERAAKLDLLLDHAWSRGMRVNLVINNHGQASTGCDPEWDSNPFSSARGGPLAQPGELFTHPRALAEQEKLRRYIVARWADHPAVLGWKLWTEMNLTTGGDALHGWHEQAFARWHALDGYGHGVTSHWSGDYNVPDRALVALPGLDYTCIDAYHGPGTPIAQLLMLSALDPAPQRGLAQFAKPLLVTEYGGNWDACPKPQLIAEHAVGAWAAMVSGHGGSPMLWWIEWLDAENRFAPYTAIARFLDGEDLRSRPNAPTAAIDAPGQSASGALWSRAWARQDRVLGYVLDAAWGTHGTPEATHGESTIVVNDLAAGDWDLAWWDADTGASQPVSRINHAGGALSLRPPPFQRHLAYKLAYAGAPLAAR